MNKFEGKYEIDERLGEVLDSLHWEEKTKRMTALRLDAMYIEKHTNDEWEYVKSAENKHIRYDIVETGRDEFDSYPYYVREWHELGNDEWAQVGGGIFCKTLEEVHNYIDSKGKSPVKIAKLDENTRFFPRWFL